MCYFFEKSKKVHFLREKYRIIRFFHVKIQINLSNFTKKMILETFKFFHASKKQKNRPFKAKVRLKRTFITNNIIFLREYQTIFSDIHVNFGKN